MILLCPLTAPDIKHSKYVIMYHNGEYLILGGVRVSIVGERLSNIFPI